MFNTSLLVSFAVILGITWTEALPNRMDIVIGSRSTQNENDVHIGQERKEIDSATGSEYVYGSVTKQNDGKYVILGRVNKTQILMPAWNNPKNGIPRSFIESIDGPSDGVNVMIPERRQAVQEKLTFLTKLCQGLKKKMYQLLDGGKNVSTITNIIFEIISTEVNLQNQQRLLDEFNIVMPLTRSKQDNFEGDLKIIELKIEQLILRALAITA